MKKNIGILGATGLVGSSVLSALQGKGYALLIGARNQYKLQCLKEEFSTENIEIIQMDVFIPKQVEMFCSQCDVVINCTSPASIVGTRIVRECIKQGNDYIDPFGEGDVEKYIVDNKLELYYHQVHIQDYQKLYLSMWQKYIKELRYLSKNTFMEIVIFRMELHKM